MEKVDLLTIKTVLICLFAIFNGQLVIGQTGIQGFVTSSTSARAPMEHVTVEITNINLPVHDRVTITDSTGFFTFKNLEAHREYHLKFSSYGLDDHLLIVSVDTGMTNCSLVLQVGCELSREQAESDWERGEAKLLLVGSIAPIGNSSADLRFEKEFKIRYHDFGCSPPVGECLQAYNERMFELLDSAYGNMWRRKVRDDVVYLR